MGSFTWGDRIIYLNNRGRFVVGEYRGESGAEHPNRFNVGYFGQDSTYAVIKESVVPYSPMAELLYL